MNPKPYHSIRVGLISLLMIIAISLLVVWKSGIMVRASGYRIRGEFTNVGGLLSGAEVRYRGYPIGRVAQIAPEPIGINVYLWIDKNIRIPKGSTLRIAFDGLIGEKFIDVQPAVGTTTMIRGGDSLVGYSTMGLVDFVDEGAQSLREMKLIIQELRLILTSPEVSNSLRYSIIDFGKITKSLLALVDEIRQTSDELQIASTVKDIQGLVKDLHDTTSIILKDGSLAEDITDISNNLSIFSKNISGLSEEISDILQEKGVTQDLRSIISNIKQLSGEINQLSKDANFKANIIDTVRETGYTLNSAGNLLRKVGNTKVSAGSGVYYRNSGTAYNYQVNVDIKGESSFLRLGIGDWSGQTQLSDLQQGLILNNALEGRIGLFYNQPGIGLDYRPLEFLRISSEYYNLNQRNLDFQGNLSLPWNMHLLLRFNDVIDSRLNDYSIGIGINY